MLKPLTALAGAALAASALAQPLAELAPADAVLTLGLEVQPSRLDTLPADLAELDWQGAAETFGRLASRLGPAMDDPFGPLGPLGPLGSVGSAAGGFDPDVIREALDGLEASCPGIADVANAVPALAPGDALLLTVGADRFAPMPSATALARFADPAPAAALQDAIVRCFSTGTPFMQGDVELHVVGDGSDLPVVIGRVGDVFMASTRPDALRAVVRRANGAGEPSLAEAPLGSAAQRFGRGGLFLTFDAAATADLLEAFALPMAAPEERPLAERAVAALRTLGGFAGRLATSPEGLESEFVLAVDPEGGDPELARLLLGSAPVGNPFLVPADAVAVSVERLPLRGILDYAQDWVDLVAASEGAGPDETTDLRALVREELGIDLDADLLSWLGEEWTTALLAAPSTDLRDLISTPRAFIVPVSDPEAARAGLARIGEALRPFAGEAAMGFGGFGAGVESALRAEMADPFAPPVPLEVAVRTHAYRGVDVTRVQTGVTTDVGIALVGNHLVIATPAAAVEAVIDVRYGGASSIVESRAWRDLIATAPSRATALGVSDDAAIVRGLADLLDLAAQPAAFALHQAVREPSTGADYGWESYGTMPKVDAEPLPPGTVQGRLEPSDLIDADLVSDVYALSGLEPGDRVRVVLTSDEFDTLLLLADASTRGYLLENDDAPDTSRSELTFEVEEGAGYLLEVASFGGDERGAYELTVEVEGGEGAAADATYGELLGLTGILPDALRVLASHLGGTASWNVVDGDVLYQGSRTAIRW